MPSLRPFAALSAIALALALLPLAAQADAKSEIVTAGTHAGLAAGSADLAGVHSHLHHALNCLVGPNGAGFDAKELNPCAQNGHGAIPDSADAATKTSLMAAADKARAGIASSDLKAAQKDASETAAMLKAVK
jgi:hypothetical protein